MHIFCAHQMTAHSQASGNSKKKLPFYSQSDPDRSPTSGTELPWAVALDPGGTGVFGGPIKSWAI